MKTKHLEAYKLDADCILKSINAHVGQDFYTLSSSQVEKLLAEADIRRYQKPARANGSRARYFYEMLQRRASHEHA